MIEALYLQVKWSIIRWATPPYDCKGCVGQEPWQGCYCQYHNFVAPCEYPGPVRHRVQALLRYIGWI